MPEITVPLRTPELGEGTWLQGPKISIGFAHGSVVLVDFWEATCIHCLRTLPYVEQWHRRYRDRGLVVIGVHTPEFEISADPEVVRAVMEEHELSYGVLLDPERQTWERFANHYWPAKYLVDHRGYLRWEHFGEGAYGQTERWIQRLLREAGDERPFPQPLEPLRPEDAPGAVCRRPTGELYLGYHRGKLQAVEGYRPEEEVEHSGEVRDAPLRSGGFGLRGRWYHAAEYLETREPGAELELVAEAASVNVVVGGADHGGGELEMEELGEGSEEEAEPGDRERLRWSRPQLLPLIRAETFRRWHLRLRFPRPGARVYTVSFTGCVGRSDTSRE